MKRKRTKRNVPSRFFTYGAQAPVQNAEKVREQLVLANRYRNKLIELEIARRDARWKVHADGEEAVRKTTSDFFEAWKKARAESGLYWGTYLVADNSFEQTADSVADFAATRGGFCGRCRQKYGVGDRIWTSKGTVTGCGKCGHALRFRRYDGTGILAAQIQHGMTIDELTSAKDTRARLVGDKKWRRLYLRVGSNEDRTPVWAVFPISFAREIPPEARIKWVRVQATRVGVHTKWFVQFALDVEREAVALPAPRRGTIAIDIGWRLRTVGEEETIRVACWVDDQGREGELDLPPDYQRRMRHADSLRSIRDRNFDTIRDWFLSEQKKRGKSWPEWLREETKTIAQWRSQNRLAGILVRWRQAVPGFQENPKAPSNHPLPPIPGGRKPPERKPITRFEGDRTLFQTLEEWRRQDKHLLTWEANERLSAIRYRNEIYRLFACEVARYKSVIIEEMDLNRFARLPEEGDEPDREVTKQARPRRFLVSLSSLRAGIENAVWKAGGERKKRDPAFSTQGCYECKEIELFDAAAAVEHVCSHCDAKWDQDFNAARNLLEAALGGHDHAKTPIGPKLRKKYKLAV